MELSNFCKSFPCFKCIKAKSCSSFPSLRLLLNIDEHFSTISSVTDVIRKKKTPAKHHFAQILFSKRFSFESRLNAENYQWQAKDKRDIEKQVRRVRATTINVSLECCDQRWPAKCMKVGGKKKKIDIRTVGLHDLWHTSLRNHTKQWKMCSTKGIKVVFFN